MKRYLLLMIILLGLTACQEKDERYYRQHVKELHTKAGQCTNCDALKALALEMSELGRELQISPQAFGNKILVLQQTIAKEQQNGSLKPSLRAHQHQLSDLLSVVTWLESPEG